MVERNTFTKKQEKQLRNWFAEKMGCELREVILAQSYHIAEEYSHFDFIEVGAYNENDSCIVTLEVGQIKHDRRARLHFMRWC